MTTRPLTQGEIALCEKVFGSSIDYSRVKVHDKRYTRLQPKGLSMAPNGELYMYGTYLPDYSTGNPIQQSLFIHEMTHVWQIQNKVLNLLQSVFDITLRHNFNYRAGYYYTLKESKDLTKYNMEQQASIVEDYFMLKHCGVEDYEGRCKNQETYDEKIRLYEKVLENFLKDPSYARKSSFNTPKKPKPPKA